MYMEDGPAGQVIGFFEECGHDVHTEAINRTEEATHSAIDSGNAVPVYDPVYQVFVVTRPAERVNEDPPSMTGRKKAVLMGCNYRGTRAELRGCINDVQTWKDVLTDVYGFDDGDILTLTDD